jgi:hypothetical protein
MIIVGGDKVIPVTLFEKQEYTIGPVWKNIAKMIKMAD